MYDVTQYGIINDGAADNTLRLRELIGLAEKNGGGTIYFPPGKYLTGSIELKSNMTLYLDAGAEILASDDRANYPVIGSERVPGLMRRGYAGIIFALGAENICVKGEGTINGRGEKWWFGGPDGRREDDYMRPRSIYFVLCRNVSISGIRIIDSPCWTVHPLCCENVAIHSVSIKNPPFSPNTDGINPESCRNVRISDCDIDVGDDCVTVKAGSEGDLLQKQHPCENITVTNCTMNRGHGGVVIGSEMSGGVRNVTVSNCVFRNTDRGVRIKTRRGRGGSVKNVLINGLIMDGVGTPVTVNCYYRCGADERDERLFSDKAAELGADTPEISGIRIRGVSVTGAKHSAMYFLGLPERPIEDVSLAEMDIEMDGSFGAGEPIMTPMHEKTCAGGVYMKNVRGLSFSGVRVKNAVGEVCRLENCENTAGSAESAN